MMDRRNFMAASATFAASAALSRVAFAAESKSEVPTPAPHQQAHSHARGGALRLAALDCVSKGQACLQHCLDSLVTGDTSMAKCSKSVREMLIYSEALEKASLQDSPYLKALAKIASEAATECESACREHASKHEVCRQCADSCAALVAQVKVVLA